MAHDFPTDHQAKAGLQAQKSSFCKPAVAKPGDVATLPLIQRIGNPYF
jgi:hypothetical protein